MLKTEIILAVACGVLQFLILLLIFHDYNDNLTLPSVDAPLSGGASLSTSVYNLISFTLPGSSTGRGAKCYDIMKGDTAHLLIGCVSPGVLQNGVRDDGSYSTTTAGVNLSQGMAFRVDLHDNKLAIYGAAFAAFMVFAISRYLWQ